MPVDNLEDFKALEPLLRIIEEGLDGSADGDDFFDMLADDVVFDYVIARLPRPDRRLQRGRMAHRPRMSEERDHDG